MTIYFAQRPQGGPIKIGRSSNPEQRLKVLAGGGSILLLATMPGDLQEERDLQRRFRKTRIRREWFSPSPELASLIGSLGGVVSTNSEVPETIADRLRIAREDRGYSSKGLSDAAGLAQGHVTLIENSVDGNMSCMTAAKIAKALNVSLNWLITGEGEMDQ